VHRRFLTEAEQALDDRDGSLHVAFLRQQTFFALQTVVNQVKDARGRKNQCRCVVYI